MIATPGLLLALLAITVLLFATDRVAPDLVALLLLAGLLGLGYLSSPEAFSGFSSEAVVILISAFVFTGALARSGASERIAEALIRITAGRTNVLRGAVLLAAAGLSLVMNNVAAATVLLPGATVALRKNRISPSQMLLPLAMATQLGGMATLLTTSNIVVSEVLLQKHLAPFRLMDFLPVGGPLAVAGLLYLYVIAPRLLPKRSETEERLSVGASPRPLSQIYELGRRLLSVRLLPGSPLAGATLGKSGLSQNLGCTVIAVVHPDGSQRRAPEPSQELAEGDILVLDGVPPDRGVLAEAGLEQIRVKRPTRYLFSPRVGLFEGVIAPRSRYAGKSLRELDFRGSHGGISVLSLWRNGSFLEGDLSNTPLQFGDALLMQGPRSAFQRLRAEGEILVLGGEGPAEAPRPTRMGWALGILAATLALGIAFPQALPAILFAGAVAMLVSGCLTTEEAYRSIDWRSVFLVAGMLPLGLALSRSGAAALLARWVIAALHARGATALLAAFTVLTALLTQVLPGGAATPLIVAPIAISAATHLGANPRAFAMAVALAASTSMLTPFAHPVNVLVMGPGGYRFGDYGRAALPLVLLLVVGIVLLVPLVMPL